MVYYCPVLNKVGSVYHGPHYDDEPCTCQTPRYEANANHAGPWPMFTQTMLRSLRLQHEAYLLKAKEKVRKHKDLVRREQKLERLARKRARVHL